MGLDMYLTRDTYIGGKWEHRDVKGQLSVTIADRPLTIDASKLSTVTEEVGYWRKANAVHQWFVDNVQEGRDDCKRYSVSVDDLKKLREDCRKALDSGEGMEPTSGFFFGSTEKDEYYTEYLKYTINLINEIMKFEEDSADEEHYYYYEASW